MRDVLRTALLGSALLASTTAGRATAAESGVSDAEIKIGMVNAQTGVLAASGKGMRVGAEAVFKAVNEKGGICGRKITLVVADDAYDPNKTVDATVKMIEEEKVFALFGYVGGPTTQAALPIVKDTHVPLVGLFTGNAAVRKPLNPDVINIRASYDEEAEALVDHFVKAGLKKIALFQQDNWVMQAGMEQAMKKRGLTLAAVGSFAKGTVAVEAGLATILAANPEVVVMAGPAAPLAAFAKKAKANGLKAKLATNSFTEVGSFVAAAGDAAEGTVFSQVVPFPEDTSVAIVKECKDLLAKYSPSEKLNFVNLEGAISAKAMVLALEKAGKDLTHASLIAAFEGMKGLDIGGLKLDLSGGDHQAIDAVFMTRIEGGKIVAVKPA